MKLLHLSFLILTVAQASAQYIAPIDRVDLSEAHKGTLEIDTRLLDSYGRPPEPRRQFYLDAREHLASSRQARVSDPEISALARRHQLALISGPMLGDLSAESVSVWLRPARSESLKIVVRGSDTPATREIAFSSEAGKAVRVLIAPLTPATAYAYSVQDKNGNIWAEGAFKTAPAPNTQDPVRIAFGADFHKIGLHNPNLFTQISKRAPLAMFLYGDIAVDGRRKQFNMIDADYLLRDTSQPWSHFAKNTPVYTSWDDWDYYANDRSGLSKGLTPKVRQRLRAAWRQHWVNPESGQEDRGIYFKTRVGPVDFFMLDTRSCREVERKGQPRSYLGAEQHAWLLESLRSSTAPFKILSSGTMWSDYVSQAKDSWGIWDVEGREEIFALIENENISGVLLISGDRHGARGFKIPRKSGFAFYEFGIGSLGGVHGPEAKIKDCPEQLFGYEGYKTIAFGEFCFDMAAPDPVVTFRLVEDTGTILEEYPIPLSQLTPQAQ